MKGTPGRPPQISQQLIDQAKTILCECGHNLLVVNFKLYNTDNLGQVSIPEQKCASCGKITESTQEMLKSLVNPVEVTCCNATDFDFAYEVKEISRLLTGQPNDVRLEIPHLVCKHCRKDFTEAQ